MFAPAKVNLALHVTGRRNDGYHLIDSLVLFADIGDGLTVQLSETSHLQVTGPRAAGVPLDGRNLCLKAAAFFGADAAICLDKHLPAEAGIGGGSSDAAAVLRALAALTGRAIPAGIATLGADIPACLHGQALRMRGIGDRIDPVHDWPPLAALLVNPGVALPTATVFRALTTAENPGLPTLPAAPDAPTLIAYLRRARNDLEPAARALAPEIGAVLAALAAQPGCDLARMSGSGATCFGLFSDAAAAARAAGRLSAAEPGWWVQPATLT